VWRAGEYYNTVKSPMLILDTLLGCAACVYEQSDAGSTTTLTMVLPVHMNGMLNFRDGETAVQAAKAASQAAPRQISKEATMQRNTLLEMSGRAMHMAVRFTLNQGNDSPMMQELNFDGHELRRSRPRRARPVIRFHQHAAAT